MLHCKNASVVLGIVGVACMLAKRECNSTSETCRCTVQLAIALSPMFTLFMVALFMRRMLYWLVLVVPGFWDALQPVCFDTSKAAQPHLA